MSPGKPVFHRVLAHSMHTLQGPLYHSRLDLSPPMPHPAASAWAKGYRISQLGYVSNLAAEVLLASCSSKPMQGLSEDKSRLQPDELKTIKPGNSYIYLSAVGRTERKQERRRCDTDHHLTGLWVPASDGSPCWYPVLASYQGHRELSLMSMVD